MEMLNNLLNFIFTEQFYLLVGKFATVLFLFGVLKGIHGVIYKNIHWYSFNFDRIALPYHWYKVMFVMSSEQAKNFFKVLSIEPKLNPNLYKVRGYLIQRLRKDGYSDTEIENISIEYKNTI